MELIDPATESRTSISVDTFEQIRGVVSQASAAQKVLKALTVQERSRLLAPLEAWISNHEVQLSSAISLDMGKPVGFARAEVDRARAVILYFTEHAPEWLSDEVRLGSTIRYEPLGNALAITPWNFPLAIPIFSIIPALLAGNSVVWKPSEFGVRTAKLLYEGLVTLSDVPRGAVRMVIGGKEHGKELLGYDWDFLTFTGSTATGKYIAESMASRCTRLQLELGGLDAAIVSSDVEVSGVAQSIVHTNAANSGQICATVKRAFVDRNIYDEFCIAASKASLAVTIGDPVENCAMGPLVGEFQLRKCEELLADAVQRGAKVLTGGVRLARKGYFFPHTVLSDVPRSARILHEEAFSPILPIVSVDSIDEAISLANDTRYGLTASIWSKNLALAESLASRLETGVVGINRHGVPPLGLPWGGAKESGIGRMRSIEGLRECCNIKVIVSC